MVTHDQKAADYAARILHVDKGQLIEADMRPAA
jgi:ABC-type lipoprotein export system ATPase subunit